MKTMKNSGIKPKLILGALGVVYGDIGTSPLYVIKECFSPEYGLSVNLDNVLGITSLIFWSLTFVVVIKYLTFIMKADNGGEGGPIALISLITKGKYQLNLVVMIGLLGTALLLADGMITPAISVLAAVEGLQVISPSLSKIIIPITVSILVVLFAIQKRGTDRVGRLFGPITLAWFITLFFVGLPHIFENPIVIKSLNPYYGVLFFVKNGVSSFLVLGAVVLCVTGAEALYADMGHIGKRPISYAWYLVVYPSLVVNYLGQAALILTSPNFKESPFFNMVPGIWLYPLVGIATLATIIASQALITGTFSIIQQAIQVGFIPRLSVWYTTRDNFGQTYIPLVNKVLMIGCISLVLIMKSSSNLAGAYGIAVIMTMTITSFLFYILTKDQWKWKRHSSLAILVVFMAFDLTFFSANIIKVKHGGWITLVIGFFIYWIMISWKKGNSWVYSQIERNSISLTTLISNLGSIHRIKGTGVFMSVNKGFVPFVLLNNVKHNKVLHEKTIILSIQTESVPEVKEQDKVLVEEFGGGIYKVVAKFGFMEIPQVKEIVSLLNKFHNLGINFSETSFYLGREVIKADGKSSLNSISKKLYRVMKTNAQAAPEYFKIPKNRTIEIGGNVSI